jgi:hypothetical protein
MRSRNPNVAFDSFEICWNSMDPRILQSVLAINI